MYQQITKWDYLHYNAINRLCFFYIPVGSQNKRPSTLPDLWQNVPQLAPSPRIHPSGGLVQEDKGRISDQRNGGAQLPFVASTTDHFLVLFSSYNGLIFHIQIWCHIFENSPVGTALPIRVFLQHQNFDQFRHHPLNVLLLDSAQARKHVEDFFSCHLVYQCVELGTVSQVLLYLERTQERFVWHLISPS